MVRFLLELLRIIIIFIVLGGIGYLVIDGFYRMSEQAQVYSWLGSLAIYLILFIVYRNKWQFTGFYKGKEGKKLSTKTTMTLICLSILLMVSPFVMGSFIG